MLRGGAVVARQAHNLKAVGSIPAPATNDFYACLKSQAFSLPKSIIIKDLQFIKIPQKLSETGETTRFLIKILSKSLFSRGLHRVKNKQLLL